MSTEVSNNGVIFTKVVEAGSPEINKNFKFTERKINISSPLKPDEILTRNLYLSLDPYLVHRMKKDVKVFEPYTVGNVLETNGIGVVVNSNNSQWKKGDLFLGPIGE